MNTGFVFFVIEMPMAKTVIWATAAETKRNPQLQAEGIEIMSNLEVNKSQDRMYERPEILEPNINMSITEVVDNKEIVNTFKQFISTDDE